MKKIKYAILMIVSLVTLILGNNISTNAAANVSVVGGKTIQDGNKITITVVASMEDMQGLGGTLNYDGNVLKYLSSNAEQANDNGGVISFVSTNVSNSKISLNFTFQALRVGKTTISAGCKVANTDDEFQASGSTIVTVVAPSNEPAPTPQSSDAKLSSLIVSLGSLSPVFDASVYDYNLQVDEGTTEVVVAATPINSKSAVTSVNGATGLVKGPNNVTVVVKAENGATLTYTIHVQVGLYPEEIVIEVQIGDQKFKVKNSLIDVVLPEGATIIELTMNGEVVQGVSYNNGMLTLVQLIDEEGNEAFYIYNSEVSSYAIFRELKVPAVQYVIDVLGDDYKVPKGYKKVLITIGEYSNVEALELDVSSARNGTKPRRIAAEKIYLFKALNMAGESKWYEYHPTTGAVYLSDDPIDIIETKKENKNEKVNSMEDFISLHSKLIILVLSLLCLGLAIPLVALIITPSKSKIEE